MTETMLPATMQAAVFRAAKEVPVESVAVPAVGPGEVLVQVSHCGICGSDQHFVLEGFAQPGQIEGHEWSGTVVAVGADVDRFAPGDLVVGGPSIRCGICDMCLAQRPSLCRQRGRVGEGAHEDGAFAQYAVRDQRTLLRVPDGLSLKHAALAEPLAVSLHGITRSGGPQPDKRYLVTGGGPIGFLSVAALKAFGVDDITVSEPSERRRELNRKLGANVVTPDELPTPPMSPSDTLENPFQIVLECSGNARAIEAGIGVLDRGGTMVIVGASIGRPKVDALRILLQELVVTGSSVYDHDGFERALELLASQKMPNDLLVEPNDFPLGTLVETTEQLATGGLAAKAMINPWT
ncbi:MAG: zinc-dependent alcohol dehydrogenase [Acidimicrobiia bacterium]